MKKGKVNLFAHLHRFGKTLALTMLKTFFEAKMDEVAKNREMPPRSYWENISSNSIVKELVENAEGVVKQEIERLIDGGCILPKIIYGKFFCLPDI